MKHLESKLSEVLPIKSNLYSERVRNKADLGLSPERIIFVYFVFLDVQLLHDAFFEVLGKVGSYLSCCTFSCYLGDVGFDHDADEVFEGSLVGVPA